MKDEQVTQNLRTMQLERDLKKKDEEIARLKAQIEGQKEIRRKSVLYKQEYTNAQNYLSELVEEFKTGMKRIYEDEIEFKSLEDTSLTFCERFSNLLFNILLIIDYQKKYINTRQDSPERWQEEESESEDDMPKENKTLRML